MRKLREIHIWVPPYLHEYLTHVHGKGPVILDPYRDAGLAIASSMKQQALGRQGGRDLEEAMRNRYLRRGYRAWSVRLSRGQSSYHGTHITEQVNTRIVRILSAQFNSAMTAYVVAAINHGAPSRTAAINEYLDQMGVSHDQRSLDQHSVVVRERAGAYTIRGGAALLTAR